MDGGDGDEASPELKDDLVCYWTYNRCHNYSWVPPQTGVTRRVREWL